jgi:GNAT superfamily N-acetyltransferase
MKVPLLHSEMPKVSRLEIRPARNDDLLGIERLLSYADRNYSGLEWWTVQEWLGSPSFLIALDPQNRVMGLMLTVTGDGPIDWLRAISVVSDRYLKPLLDASVQAVHKRGSTGLAFLGNAGWILSKLRQADFLMANQVVTLRCRGQWRFHHGPPGLEVREATPADIDALLTVDHAAFTPLWWYDRRVLQRALNLAYCFDVAYLAGECVGYQLCTLRNRRGHIVRLATHPRWQRRGIAGRLLSTAIKTLDDAGAESVTVNTQEDNQTSLHLYQGFSFERVGQPWAVWFKSLVKI